MKAGDILIFDNRLVHFSPENNSNKPRIVAMSGLFPEAAAILNCYKDEQIENAPLEIYEQDNHFLLNNVNFYHDCTKRPVLGKKIKEIAVQLPEFNEEKFLKKAKDYGIEKVNNPKIVNSNPNIKIISEPTEKDNSIRNFFSKLIN